MVPRHCIALHGAFDILGVAPPHFFQEGKQFHSNRIKNGPVKAEEKIKRYFQQMWISRHGKSAGRQKN